MIYEHPCGCIVEHTDIPVRENGGFNDRLNRPIMQVKHKKCPACTAYVTQRNEMIPDATRMAHQQVPELRTSKPETFEREQATKQWNQAFFAAMDDLCQDL